MGTVLSIVVVLSLVGAFFGLILALANKKLAVELNPLIHLVEDILPKGQCGACGFAGCMAYAEAVVLNKEVSPDLCIPGKKAVAQKVADLTGKKSLEVEPRIAYLKCANPIATASKKYLYSGIQDCVAENLLHFGQKECNYGCIGLGTCVKQCVFEAIQLNELGLPVIDSTKCTGCGKCADACPKNIIQMIPPDAPVGVVCNSLDKGAVARKACSVACIGCGLCKKQCPYEAIELKNNLAWVNSQICLEKCTQMVCLDKCPTQAIKACLNKVVKGIAI
ncbi:electron transport complex protein RnfB [Candidatus Desulfosporosinus infrequens]|uniref:Ion-translocating oxidoreductase complex subunit B n=1 Tax=Candidatus Desulfosporosinus infrequens TaxID=2043169 RepID=A0A2U3KGF1_9FIRM|nr:electron transport complex protein RnfB [Candidatus Desulfosporosinus infrequens]